MDRRLVFTKNTFDTLNEDYIKNSNIHKFGKAGKRWYIKKNYIFENILILKFITTILKMNKYSSIWKIAITTKLLQLFFLKNE